MPRTSSPDQGGGVPGDEDVGVVRCRRIVYPAESIRLLVELGIGSHALESGAHRPNRGRENAHLVRARCRSGPRLHKVRYFTAADLVETSYRGLADNAVGKIIESLLRVDLIIVDELGFAPLDDHVNVSSERQQLQPDYGRFDMFKCNTILILDRSGRPFYLDRTDPSGQSSRLSQATGSAL
ncbi:ATP-binding protein [Nocardia sp. NPDC005366]|uniref:ATP-binding protein n=1 Tax=Nocardia sp. NPDC005366 TaxID=3156878 RepID=UPI0033B60116